MKNMRGGLILAGLMLAMVGQMAAAEGTNPPALALPAWKSITNRWAAVAVEAIKQKAEQGDISAQYYLAAGYFAQDGPGNDPVQAFTWMKQVANQGVAKAQRNLGYMYEEAVGVAQDYAAAARLYQAAAEQGDSMAQNNLAWLYHYGNGVARDNALAEKWMAKSLDLNSAEGQMKMGDFLSTEFGPDNFQLTNSFPAAGEWYRKAADQGLAAAQYALAQMYNTGKLGDDHRADCIPWFLKAAAQGNAAAQAELAQLPEFYPNSPLLKSTNPVDALKQSAEQGDLTAQFELAMRYHLGDGVPKDPEEAFKWMAKAAEHDISPVTTTIDAHYYLGVMYETGEGVARNLTNAWKLYQEAAVGGNKPDPFVRLGQMYEKGEGVAQDDRQAADNYIQGLQFGFFPTSDDTARTTGIEHLLGLYDQKRGLPDDLAQVGPQLDEIKRTPVLRANAQFLLGDIYDQGLIVPRDLVEAIAWFQLAANQKWDGASQRLAQLEAMASDAQRSAASKRFDDLNRSIQLAQMLYQQSEGYRRTHGW